MMQLPSPPREVETLYPHVILKAIIWIVFVAAIPAMIFSVGIALDGLFLRAFGRDVTARVISAEEQPDAIFGGYSRTVAYAYTLADGRERTSDSRITWREWHRLSMPHVTPAGRPERIVFTADAPAEMTVRVYTLGPLISSRAQEDEWGRLYLPIGTLFAAVFCFLLFALWLALVTRPRRYKRLYTHGVAVPGQVTDRRSRYWHKIGMKYYVDYAFTAGGSGQRVIAKREVPSVTEYDAAVPGTLVTVLHEPDNPRYSVVYEYGGYRCIGPRAEQ